MNQINITGRITTDPELKTVKDDIHVCSFTLAVKRPRTKDTTDFINCTAWKQSAEYLTKYAKKGNLIAVSGSLTSRKYEDKDGNKRIAWDVQADLVENLSSKGESTESSEAKADANSPFVEVSTGEELPF